MSQHKKWIEDKNRDRKCFRLGLRMSHLLDDPPGLLAEGLLEDDGAEAIIHPELGDLLVRQLGHLGQVILKRGCYYTFRLLQSSQVVRK